MYIFLSHLQYLKLPISLLKQPHTFSEMDNRSTQELQNLTDFKYAWYKNGKYSVNIKSYLTLGNGKANETETEQFWEIFPGEYKHIDLRISDMKYIHFDSQMKPFYEIVDKINTATNHLSLLLDDDKTIEQVENQKRILEKWEDVKRKELRFLQLVKDSYNEIIEIYDKEFGRIDLNIKNNLLYQIMFYPFPDIGVNLQEKGTFKDREILSVMFPGEKIVYSSDYTLEENKDGYQLNVKGHLKEHSGDFHEIYAKKFQKTLEVPLEYDFMLDGEYIYNKDSVLSEIVFHVKEKLNDAMLYVCRYHIQLLK